MLHTPSVVAAATAAAADALTAANDAADPAADTTAAAAALYSLPTSAPLSAPRSKSDGYSHSWFSSSHQIQLAGKPVGNACVDVLAALVHRVFWLDK